MVDWPLPRARARARARCSQTDKGDSLSLARALSLSCARARARVCVCVCVCRRPGNRALCVGSADEGSFRAVPPTPPTLVALGYASRWPSLAHVH